MSSLQIFDSAICVQISDSYAQAALGSERFDPIDLELARKQHAGYVRALQYCGCDVTVLPADERYPDCVFAEDPAVIIGNFALITQPGHESRKGETVRMRALLQSMGFVCLDITDPEAKIDGGDVQWTGKEILVGISHRTNRAGVNAVAKAFPGYPVPAYEVSGPLHLKTLIGLCGEDTLCVATESLDSIKMYERIKDQSSVDYKAIFVPEDAVANTILINGRVICKSAKENPRSFEALFRQCPHELVQIESSEIEKAVGSLTCLSLRFNKPSGVGPSPMPSDPVPVAVVDTSSTAQEEDQKMDAPAVDSTVLKHRLRAQVQNGSMTKKKLIGKIGKSESSDEDR